MFVSMINFIPTRSEQDKVLILVPSIEILKQVQLEVYDRLSRDYRVGVEQAGSTADISNVDM
jgi:hypothetical protein